MTLLRPGSQKEYQREKKERKRKRTRTVYNKIKKKIKTQANGGQVVVSGGLEKQEKMR